ncbi:DNA-directed RNA polymerase subunit beta' [Striga asiatica]|uniref:DNA-directed RNA polymerase subunit beta n=1 Tax=Striga asiatica TaxID=4170 RepID=A0A5A7RBU3_STRAF|nr:DNA-directed RNA polymerase subunit beta' [Striga asiatica]
MSERPTAGTRGEGSHHLIFFQLSFLLLPSARLPTIAYQNSVPIIESSVSYKTQRGYLQFFKDKLSSLKRKENQSKIESIPARFVIAFESASAVETPRAPPMTSSPNNSFANFSFIVSISKNRAEMWCFCFWLRLRHLAMGAHSSFSREEKEPKWLVVVEEEAESSSSNESLMHTLVRLSLSYDPLLRMHVSSPLHYAIDLASHGNLILSPKQVMCLSFDMALN